MFRVILLTHGSPSCSYEFNTLEATTGSVVVLWKLDRRLLYRYGYREDHQFGELNGCALWCRCGRVCRPEEDALWMRLTAVSISVSVLQNMASHALIFIHD
jgi:hypothetical protein